MKKKFRYIFVLLFLVVITSTLYFVINNKFSNEINIYVSTDGLDSNTGDKKSPLKTIEAAKEMIRSLVKDEDFNKEIIKVNLKEGIYYVNNTLFFNKLDCRDDIKIIYTSYKNEKVILTSTSFFNNNDEKFIVLNNVNNLILRNLTIQNTLGNAIEIKNCNNILLDNIVFQNPSEKL